MLSIRKTAVPYVLEADRELPIDRQTIFFIRQKTLDDENAQASYYQDAANIAGRSRKKFSKTKLTSADIKSFCICVTRVENYFISTDAPEINDIDAAAHFEKAMSNEGSGIERVTIGQGTYFKVPVIEGDDVKYVVATLDGNSRVEILEATEDVSRLNNLEKKG